MRKTRSDREPYGVYVRREHWHGWFYTPAGERKTNITLFHATDKDMAPVRIRCLRPENPNRCPNFKAAMKAIAYAHESYGKCPPRKIPTLREAIEEWRNHLLVKGCRERRNSQRVQQIISTIDGLKLRGNYREDRQPLVIQGTRWQDFGSLNRGDFRDFLLRMAGAGRAARTRNQYLTDWKTFLDFCVTEKYIGENPFADFEPAGVDSDSHLRRPFTRDEFEKLLACAAPEHAIYYHTLGRSGLRKEEANQLRKHHLDPVSARPEWRLTKDIVKEKRAATLPMMPTLARALAQRWYLIPENGLLFPDPPSYYAFYKDVARAGLERVNASGHHLCFHSFRYFFAVEASKTCKVREVQFLMRHAQYETTVEIYTRFNLEKMHETIVLPNF